MGICGKIEMMNPSYINTTTSTGGFLNLDGWNLDIAMNITKVAYTGQLVANQRSGGLVTPLNGYGIWATVYTHITRTYYEHYLFTNGCDHLLQCPP
jgi:hypothetical protein